MGCRQSPCNCPPGKEGEQGPIGFTGARGATGDQGIPGLSSGGGFLDDWTHTDNGTGQHNWTVPGAINGPNYGPAIEYLNIGTIGTEVRQESRNIDEFSANIISSVTTPTGIDPHLSSTIILQAYDPNQPVFQNNLVTIEAYRNETTNTLDSYINCGGKFFGGSINGVAMFGINNYTDSPQPIPADLAETIRALQKFGLILPGVVPASNLTRSSLILSNTVASNVSITTQPFGVYATLTHNGNGINFGTDVASSFTIIDNVQAAIGANMSGGGSAQLISNANFAGLDLYGTQSGIRFNDTSTTPFIGGGQSGLYVTNGALYFKGGNGTITLVAPA